MSSGSWLGKQVGPRHAPAPMNAWDKAALGFITPKVVKRGASATADAQPAATGGAGTTAVKVAAARRQAHHRAQRQGRRQPEC